MIFSEIADQLHSKKVLGKKAAPTAGEGKTCEQIVKIPMLVNVRPLELNDQLKLFRRAGVKRDPVVMPITAAKFLKGCGKGKA